LLRAMGEPPGERVLGVVVSNAPEAANVAVIYARGEDASGIPEFEVSGWSPAPALGALRQR